MICLDIVKGFQVLLDTYLIMLRVKQDGIKYHFLVFGITRPGIELRSPGPLVGSHEDNGS